MAPALVTADDVMTFALDGTALGDARTPYLERFIHGSIYRARPDVRRGGAQPFAGGDPVRHRRRRRSCGRCSTWRRSCAGRRPVFEIRDAAGPDNDMLVRDEALGDALARSLGDAASC